MVLQKQFDKGSLVVFCRSVGQAVSVLVLAGIKLIFFIAANMRLCF